MKKIVRLAILAMAVLVLGGRLAMADGVVVTAVGDGDCPSHDHPAPPNGCSMETFYDSHGCPHDRVNCNNPGHDKSTTVHTSGDDLGGWSFDADPTSVQHGRVAVDCTH